MTNIFLIIGIMHAFKKNMRHWTSIIAIVFPMYYSTVDRSNMYLYSTVCIDNCFVRLTFEPFSITTRTYSSSTAI